jgi:hypothetical protein
MARGGLARYQENGDSLRCGTAASAPGITSREATPIALMNYCAFGPHRQDDSRRSPPRSASALVGSSNRGAQAFDGDSDVDRLDWPGQVGIKARGKERRAHQCIPPKMSTCRHGLTGKGLTRVDIFYVDTGK